MSLLGAQHWTQQFVAPDTGVYAGCRVFHYAAGTSTDTDVWTDEAKTSAAAQPVVGDGQGRVSFYGDNIYRLVVKTSVADGDIQLYDYDNVKIMQKDAALRAENRGPSYPSASSSNIGLIYGKTDSTGDISELGMNLDGTQFSPFQFQSGSVTARQQTWAYGADLASATTLTLGSDGNVFNVTGNTTITGVSTTTAGTPIILRMQGQAQLQHNATSLILWNGANWTPETGDVIFIESLGSGNYYEVARRSNSLLTDPNELQNVSLLAGVSGNILTVSLKTSAGDDPSGTDYCRISFRSSTLTTGTYTNRTVSSAKSVSLSSGSTAGFQPSAVSRIYVVAMDSEAISAGTGVELGLYHPWNMADSTLSGIQEASLYTSTAEGGAGAADSAQTLYSTTARSNVAVRILGYVDIQTGSTAGQWSNSPTRVQIMGFGVPRTGDVIQHRRTQSGAVATATGGVPNDDTKPLVSEGDQFFSIALTPVLYPSLIRCEHIGFYAHTTSQRLNACIFQSGSTESIGVGAEFADATGAPYMIAARAAHIISSASAVTFSVRANGATGATLTLNGSAGSRLWGGALCSTLEVNEVCL